jgi:hypothetical protein
MPPLRQVSRNIRVAALPLLGVILLGSVTNMNIDLQPVPVPSAASLNGVQLLDGKGVELLAGSGGTLSLIPEGQSEAQARATLRLGGLPGKTWDALLDGGALHAVYTEPGSAVCWIMSQRSEVEGATRLHSETFAVYLQPHYVKGAVSADAPVTAIRHQAGKAQVVYFPRSDRETVALRVGEPAASITDSRLLRDSNGYWLFTLARAPGAATPRQTPSGRRTGGILHAIRLGKDLKSVGVAAIPILGAQPVYEFDVDRAPDGQTAIFATTQRGAIYASGALSDSPLPPEAWKETVFERPLSSPSLLLRNGVAYCAAIENMRKPDARVLRGRIVE